MKSFKNMKIYLRNLKLSSILESDVNFKEKYLEQFKKDKNIYLMLNASLIKINSTKKIIMFKVY